MIPDLTTETTLKSAVVDTLRRLRWKVYVTSERRRGYSKFPVGWPDVFARNLTKRVAVWIEVKRPGEHLSVEQEEFRNEALANGEWHWTIESLAQLHLHLARV